MNETRSKTTAKTTAQLRKEAGYITGSEAARLCGVKQETFARWWKEGRVPIERLRFNRIVRYSKWDFDEWLAAQVEDPPTDDVDGGDDDEEDDEDS